MTENLKNLFSAVIKAQAEMPTLVKDKKNPFFDSKYADLGQSIEVSKPILSKYGLAIIQFPITEYRDSHVLVGVRTMLVHESGESIEDRIVVPLQLDNPSDDGKKKKANLPQQSGIIITYLKRYAWQAMTALYSENEDVDGNMGAVSSESILRNHYTEKATDLVVANKEKHSDKIKEIIGKYKGGKLTELNLSELENLVDELKKLGDN